MSRSIYLSTSVSPSTVPKTVRAAASSSNSLNVSWGPLRTGQHITKYTVYYHVNGSSIRSNTTVQAPAVQTTIAGLLKYTDYIVSVSASTSGREGPQSNEVTERTDEDGKPADKIGHQPL